MGSDSHHHAILNTAIDPDTPTCCRTSRRKGEGGVYNGGSNGHPDLLVNPAGISSKYLGRGVGCAWEWGMELMKQNWNPLITVAASDGVLIYTICFSM